MEQSKSWGAQAAITLPSPDSLPDFQSMFPDEDRCADYLSALRWPKGYRCATCRVKAHSVNYKRQMVQCRNGHQVYITAGTIMHGSHTPLLTWFYAAYLATTFTPGMSAVQFQRQLGISRYETAFQILHKLRGAMVDPDRGLLKGKVEVDEAFIGGAAIGAKAGRSLELKTAVVGAVEVRRTKDGGVYAGRLRMRTVPDTTAYSLGPFVSDHVAPGAHVHTDGWGGYNDLSTRGFRHRATVQDILPSIHLEFSNLKTWLKGTHHGRVERQHLQAYLNEFVFRHNRRFWPFSAFQRVLSLGLEAPVQTYRQLYDTDDYGRDVHVSGVGAQYVPTG